MTEQGRTMKKIHWMAGILTILIYQIPCLADCAVQGVRAGLQGGYGVLDNVVLISQSVPPPPKSDSSNIAGRGVLGGITLEWGNVIGNTDMYMGVEGSFNFSTTKGKKNVVAGTNEDLTTSIFFRRSIDLVGKIGCLMRDAALPYFKLGPTMGHWKASSVSNSANASGNLATTSIGFVVGVGSDFPVTERFAFGVGYDYRYYKNFTHFLNNNPTNNPLLKVAVTPSAHTIMFRLTFKLSATDFSTSTPPKERKRKRYKKPKPEA